MSSPSMGFVDEWKWLDNKAKTTGIPWCGWPREWSSSKTACRTCISFYSRIQWGSDKTKQLEHIEKQKQVISKRKQNVTTSATMHGLCSVQKHIDKQLEELQRERTAEDMGSLTTSEELKRDGQYCSYHHSCYDKRRCVCERDREGYLKWYSSYDHRKCCMVCNSRLCDCPRFSGSDIDKNTKGDIIPKIVVKLIYEEEKGFCRIHPKKKGCECPSSIKSVVTTTHDGTDFHTYCTLHRDTGCDCGKDPKFCKILKMIGYEYLD